MMKLSIAFALLALTACTEGNPTPLTAADIKGAPPASACPLGVEGARVVYEPTETGARLTFTAPSERIEDLRTRARNAAAMHGPGQKLGEGHNAGKHGEGGNHGLKAAQMPPAYAGEQDLEGGARIDITPVDTANLPALRSKVQVRARELMASCE